MDSVRAVIDDKSVRSLNYSERSEVSTGGPSYGFAYFPKGRFRVQN